MKIDTALYNNEKQHQLEGYFFVDKILSLSHRGTLAGLKPRYGREVGTPRTTGYHISLTG